MYPVCFFMLFFRSPSIQALLLYTLFSTCSTIKKLITLVHIWQIGMLHSAAYCCVTSRYTGTELSAVRSVPLSD